MKPFIAKKNNFLLIIAILILSSMSLGFRKEIQPTWQKISSSINGADITSILLVPTENSPVILVGTQQGVYRSVDEGKIFQPVLQPPSSRKRINYLYIIELPAIKQNSPSLCPPICDSTGRRADSIDETNGRLGVGKEKLTFWVFAATNSGLFMSRDRGLRWEQIFSSENPLSQQCLAVVTDRDTVYLGTADGLFYKKIDGGVATWQKKIDFLESGSTSTDKVITCLAKDNQYIYLATHHEVFRMDRTEKSIQKIFSLMNREKELEAAENPAESTEPSYAHQIKQIKIAAGTVPEVYLVTTKGIFKSPDQGATWTNLSSDELPAEAITSLAVLSGQQVCVGTHKGVFQYHDERWFPLYQGMETNRVNFLTLDDHDRIYAATDKGIFFMDEEQALAKIIDLPAPADGAIAVRDYAQLQKYFQQEPSVTQVHGMAIQYAEVYPQKISRWRNAAQKRALLPKLSMGLNRGATELFHWDAGPNPDILSKGRDYLDWNVALSWDFGDLIWNPDQTSIDSRSKLMVELREDILDQITRIYFERRRLQMEFLSSEKIEPQIRVEKEMRIAELTALIDALTGGEFSRRINEN